MKNNRLILWIINVWLISCICYIPMFCKKNDIILPHYLLYSKYLFVAVPSLISLVFIIKEHSFKQWISDMFLSKIRLKQLLLCIFIMIIGVCASYAYYNYFNKIEEFKTIYPNLLSIAIGSVYLFFTGLLEEIGWRGYLLNKLSFSQKNNRSIILVGIVWGIWHMPFWTIRNSLGAYEVLMYFIWTIAVSFVLGRLYYKNKNILIVALMHMGFNISFTAPVTFNIIVLIVFISIYAFFSGSHMSYYLYGCQL